MKTLIHPFARGIDEADVIKTKVFPLVRELAHKYDLMVLGTFKRYDELNGFYMARQDGIVLCRVFFMEEKGAFAIRNCVTAKDRGRSMEDKLTFFGKKVAFLMKVIKNEGLIPESTLAFVNTAMDYPIKSVLDDLASSYGGVRKAHELSPEIIHNLIEIAFGNRHLSTLSAESISKMQTALDQYKTIDETRITRTRELSRVFSSPMWAVIHDELDSFCVGKLNIDAQWANETNSTPSSMSISIAEDFRRVADVTEITELIPTMVMLKTSLEQTQQTVRKIEYVGESGFFPRGWRGVSTELNVMTPDFSGWGTRMLLKPQMILIPT